LPYWTDTVLVNYAVTQTVDLKGQLDAGARVFDIRVLYGQVSLGLMWTITRTTVQGVLTTKDF
jgi:hypothetical protein